MTGTLINVSTVLAGGAVGSVVGGRFPLATRATLLHKEGRRVRASTIPADSNGHLLLAGRNREGLDRELAGQDQEC